MSGTVKYLNYRGELTALLGLGESLIVATDHAEQHPTGVWIFGSLEKPESGKMADKIPGATALIKDDKSVYIAGSAGTLWKSDLKLGKVKALAEVTQGEKATGLALASSDDLVVAYDTTLVVVGRSGGKIKETLEVGEQITSLASDPEGVWLVAGTSQGNLKVWNREKSEKFEASASARIHEGKISAICFDRDELQVLTIGVDGKLLVTYLRGKLDPQDRGGSEELQKSNVIAFGALERFYTSGFDRSIKAWPAGRNKKRPASQPTGVPRVKGLDFVTYNDRPHVVVIGTDRSIRLFGLEEDGKVGELALTLRDALEGAKQDLNGGTPQVREKALRTLAKIKDGPALKMFAKHLGRESDHKLKVLGTKLLGETKDRRVLEALEATLSDKAEDVQVAALEGLQALEDERPLRPLKLALATGHKKIGVLALRELGKLAKSDDGAFDMITQALENNPVEVRQEALIQLISIDPKNKVDAYILALHAKKSDVRIAAMVGAYKDGLLGELRIEAALRRLCEDSDQSVRHTAFLISLYRRPSLVSALRTKDSVIHRALFEIEESDKKDKGAKKLPTAPKFDLSKLNPQDFDPLLEAMASSATEICMKGAKGLAMLGDTRALGTLLQLSRSDTSSIRVETAKALGVLGDSSALGRLHMMLRDGDGSVRDQAFTGISKFSKKEPLELAKVGLYAEHEDVHKRGLDVLAKHLKTKSGDSEALALLEVTLQDRFQSVRSEALKAVINLEVGGNREAALRFGNRSIHADVRLDVLTEAMADYKEGWAWNLILEMYEDEEEELRHGAFEFAVEKAKRERRQQALSAALQSKHEDMRLLGVNELTTKRLQDVEDLLVEALNDESVKIRTRAVDAIVNAKAYGIVERALGSTHTDVQLRAAIALAQVGNSKALETLSAIATAEEPDKEKEPKEHKVWMGRVTDALEGIAKLGETGAGEQMMSLLDSKHGNIRRAAAHAIVWTSSQESLGLLSSMLRHKDKDVRREAAFGLAYFGDTSSISLVTGEVSSVLGIVQSTGSSSEQLLAAFGLLQASPNFLLSMIDADREATRKQAFLLLLLLTLSQRDEVMNLCLAALSSQHAEIRLEAAKSFEAFVDPAQFEQFVVASTNQLLTSGQEPLGIGADVVKTLSAVLAHGAVGLKIRAVQLLDALQDDSSKAFDRQWELFLGRYDDEIKAIQENLKPSKEGRLERAWQAIRGLASSSKSEKAQMTQGFLQLAFGAYVGLARGRAGTSVRLQALGRLDKMSRHGDLLDAEVRRVMLMSLGDEQATVRQLAFDSLLESSLEPQALANEALSTTYADMGSRGLDLLAKHAGKGEGQALLRDTMLNKTDGLEVEAAKLLEPQMKWAEFWALGLGAKSKSWRRQAMDNLFSRLKEDKSAKPALFEALSSRFEDVRFGVARKLSKSGLSAKERESLIKVLREFLWSDDSSDQQKAAQALGALEDTSVGALFLDRWFDNANKTARNDLLDYAGRFGDLSIFDRLMGQIERNNLDAFKAAFLLTGYNQSVKGKVETEEQIKAWSDEQKPRHNPQLVALLDVAYRMADAAMISIVLPSAKWALTPKIDSKIRPLLTSSHESTQLEAIQAYSWRVKHREADKSALVALLGTGSAKAQFLAARGLARAGHAEGMSVLMTAVSFMEDFRDRRDAVLALGELGSPQTLELLLGIALDEEHELRASAIEAIGHLSKTDRADEIFELLVQMTKTRGHLVEPALNGLRHFDTAPAWRQIRELATSSDIYTKRLATKLLGHNKDEANVDLLSKLLLKDRDWTTANAALEGLKTFYGEGALEPYYLQVQSQHYNLTGWNTLVEKLKEDGDPEKILGLLPKIQHQVFVQPLTQFLINSQPIQAAAAQLDSDEYLTATTSAKILAYAAAEAKPHAKALVKATQRTAALWEEATSSNQTSAQELSNLANRYTQLIWACSRSETGLDEILEAAGLINQKEAFMICHTALGILGQDWVGKKGIKALEQALSSENPKHRQLAASVLSQVEPDKAQAKLEGALDDAILFETLQKDPTSSASQKAARQGVSNIHQQGVVLDTLVANEDVEGLEKVLLDEGLSDEVRTGALEALSMVATEKTDALLIQIGTKESEDEDLRKSAWKALRRSRRLRQRRASKEVSR